VIWWEMAVTNVRCKKCDACFDFEVGKIWFGERLEFEHMIRCVYCGVLTLNDVELTELGQTQVSALFFNEQE